MNVCIKKKTFLFPPRFVCFSGLLTADSAAEEKEGGGGRGSATWKMKTLRHDSELFLFFFSRPSTFLRRYGGHRLTLRAV